MLQTLGRVPDPVPRLPGIGRWIAALSLLAVLMVLIVTGRVVVLAGQDAWSQAAQASENLRLAVARDIARNLGACDLSLRGVIEALEEPGIDRASPGVRRRALFGASASTADLGGILVIDAAGRIVEDSTSPVPHQIDLSDRDYFDVQRDRPDAGLFISRSYRSRFEDGDFRISLSRRLPTADGRFRGIVEVSLRLAFFKRLFSQLDLGPSGTITLFRSDGRVLFRYPFREQDIDRDLSQATTFLTFVSTDHGRLVTRAAIDGAERLYTFGRIPGQPLILTISLATDDILAPWWRRPLLITPILLVLFTIAIMSILLFHRELRRRIAAEIQTRKAAETFASLAKTDMLTGIDNRRSFETEWRRVIGGHASPTALLMIDVDCFKAFNDRFGHQDGDLILKAVATCISKIGRPGDLVARFGGEEFVVLLPDTDRKGAADIAERIRSAVVDLDIDHPGSPLGRLTVSVGVASCRAIEGELGPDLVKAADLALYEAKHNGRNQVHLWTAPAIRQQSDCRHASEANLVTAQASVTG